jgi:hypothetical protein
VDVVDARATEESENLLARGWFVVTLDLDPFAGPCFMLSEVRSKMAIFGHLCPQKFLQFMSAPRSDLEFFGRFHPHAISDILFGQIYPHGGLDIKFSGKCPHNDEK